MSLYDKIYEVVYQVPRGKVATYGQIAELANLGQLEPEIRRISCNILPIPNSLL